MNAINGMSPSVMQAPPVDRKGNARRAAVASYLGTTVEFYDFFIYGTAAALIFPTVFFQNVPPALGVILSYVTLAAGYAARPLGGILFGHFGDRVGRKKMLVLSMMIMGVVSIAIGLLPSTASIGVLAPVLLVLLRVIQGIAVGGEWAGASLMALEHAQPKNRGFAASIVSSGAPSGAVFATLVFAALSSMPKEQLLAWGWRVAFLASVILVIIAVVLRTKVTETPEFLRDVAEGKSKTKVAPLLSVLRHSPGRLTSGTIAGIAPFFLQSLLATFFITYAVAQGHVQSTVLWMVTIANALMIFTVPAFAALSDRIGRKPVMLAGYAGGILTIWAVFGLVSDGSTLLLLLAFIIANPIINGLMYGPMGAFLSEKFSTETRYTGMALSYQIATLVGAGFAPLIASSLLISGGGETWMISLCFVGMCLIGALAVLLGKEHTKKS